MFFKIYKQLEDFESKHFFMASSNIPSLAANFHYTEKDSKDVLLDISVLLVLGGLQLSLDKKFDIYIYGW